MKRFAEVEVGIGISIFFAAASLTSVPPGHRPHAGPGELARRWWTRNTPVWPRFTSPRPRFTLALPALQAQLDHRGGGQGLAAAAARRIHARRSGELPPRNAADIAWSEYNHHWAGLFVLLIGGFGAAEPGGRALGPALAAAAMLGLAGFLLIRSDPEVWPMGYVGVWESLRDVEVFQHRMFVLLIIVFRSVRVERAHVGRHALAPGRRWCSRC